MHATYLVVEPFFSCSKRTLYGDYVYKRFMHFLMAPHVSNNTHHTLTCIKLHHYDVFASVANLSTADAIFSTEFYFSVRSSTVKLAHRIGKAELLFVCFERVFAVGFNWAWDANAKNATIAMRQTRVELYNKICIGTCSVLKSKRIIHFDECIGYY